MLIIPPTLFRKRRRLKSAASVPVPPGPPLSVGAVYTYDPPQPGEAFWEFDGEVTLTGVPTGLRVQVGGVWIDPTSAEQDGPVRLRVLYPTEETLGFDQYSIIATPSGIAQAADVVLPQTGEISVP
jgi:hypothetical protein